MTDVNLAKVKECPTCGHKITKNKHSVAKHMIQGLIKMRQAVIDKGENSIHTYKDMLGKPYELKRYEASNWTNMRYLGLVAKVRRDDKTHIRGHWLLTRRGARFLNGKCKIPKAVWTVNKKIVEWSNEWVSVGDVMGDVDIPYYADIEFQETERLPFEIKLDENGQAGLF